MAKLSIVKGTTSKSIDVFIQDSSVTTGAGLSGLAYNSSGIQAWYRRGATGTPTQIGSTGTLTSLANAQASYSSGGFVSVSSMTGLYRFDVPDAALASGVDDVRIMLFGATNMVPCVVEIQLTSADLNDSVRLGITALPNATAAAAGGLFTRGTGAGQINQDANGRIDVNPVAWNGTGVATPDTAGYPKVTVSNGTGTGQISITSGRVLATSNLGAAFGYPEPPTRIVNGDTSKSIYFFAINSTDHVSRVTGISSFTVYRSRNGGSATAYTTPTIAEVSSSNMPGVYKFLLDEDMTLDAGDYSQEMCFYITASGMDPVVKTIELYRRDVDAPTRGVALSDIPFYMVDSTDHVTPKTGLTITAQVSKDAGSFAGAAGSAAEIGSGLYQFDATAADMTADVVVFKFTASGADPVLLTIKTVT